jgi:hypothetical protein
VGWFLRLFLGVFVTWVAGGVFLGIRIGGEVSLLPSQGVLCFWWLAAHSGVFINLFGLFFQRIEGVPWPYWGVWVVFRSDLKLLKAVPIEASRLIERDGGERW